MHKNEASFRLLLCLFKNLWVFSRSCVKAWSEEWVPGMPIYGACKQSVELVLFESKSYDSQKHNFWTI